MASNRVVVDAGPLVALLREHESSHQHCAETLATLHEPMLTTWPVLAEAAWLLRREHGGLRGLGELIEVGAMQLVPLGNDALYWSIDFVERYANLGAQLADATVMFVAEQNGIDTIFTLDRRDFSVYRTSKGKALRIIPDVA